MWATSLLSRYLAKRMAGQDAKQTQAATQSPASAAAVAASLSVRQVTVQSRVARSSRPGDPVEAEKADEYFEPLTAEQAVLVRSKLGRTSSLMTPWRLIALQIVMGGVAAAVAWGVSGEMRMVQSVAYGALATVVPAGVFAWGVMRRQGPRGVISAGLRFFVWEAAKVALTVAMLFAAPAVVVNVSWLALLAGFVVTMKVYWLAIWLYPVRKDSI